MILMCVQRHIHISPTVMDVSNVGLALNDRKMTDKADRTISHVCRNNGRRGQEKENEVKICHSWKIIANQYYIYNAEFQRVTRHFRFFLVTFFSFFDFLKLQIRLTFGHTVYIDELVFINCQYNEFALLNVWYVL